MTRIGEPPIGVILVHGWLGAPADLAPLAARLARQYDVVENLQLPGHGDNTIQPAFIEAELLAAIATAIDKQRDQGRRLVLIGHSTGGSLLLAEIARRLSDGGAGLNRLLLLVVLCATPPRVDLGYAHRWGSHTANRTLDLDAVGGLVSLVNRLARRGPLGVPAPVLIAHGDADELVPVADAAWWRNRFIGAQRRIRIAGAKHPLFSGDGAEQAIDVIARAIDDARRREPAADALTALAPGLASFTARWPDSARHIVASPAGMRAVGRTFNTAEVAECEPTLANIEITTRCTLGCVACARTQLKLQSRFMNREDFQRALEALPHAWRVNLVGLGEPLLHPDVVEFIQLAVTAGRRVGLVTNAMQLDAATARALCASGLSHITFSLDAVDQATAKRVRPGSDMAAISANIRGFIEEMNRQGVKLGTAVFTALSGETIDRFESIIDFAADHHIDALMVTDLNFPSNQTRSVHHAYTPASARGFSSLLRKALKRAVARRLPVLSVRGLEEFALDQCYLDYLLLRGEQLAHRSERHRHCLSPWQTIPVNVDGKLTICDCQPGAVLGNIRSTPVSRWWNGPLMIEQRRCMLSDNPPEACRVCPRF
ncbi:MAG: alpha/beta fold hydrolase [Pseudomonadota bacterium]|nr:alpha/beta fold hydrolase [Pseudomonadota bacterium]